MVKQRVWLVMGVAVLSGGCAEGTSGVRTKGGFEPPPSAYAIDRCVLDVVLEPAAHRIEARAELSVVLKDGGPRGSRGELYLELHKDLGIDEMTCGGEAVPFSRMPTVEKPADHDASEDEGRKAPPPAVYRLAWSSAGRRSAPLVIHYGGRLHQDVAAGEKPGEIHNFQMRAHVGEEGIYLSEGGAWYPHIAEPEVEGDPTCEPPMTQFELTATEVPGMVLVSCGNREGAAIGQPRGTRTTWRMPFRSQAMALVGGAHEVHQRQVGDVLVSVHLSDDNASFAPGLLDATESYLRLYQPLIGDYPYDEFTIVENFFSSGFAFPGFTLLASAVIEMGEMGLKPGYLDHEMLHNWWGNGVLVSALDGNWCECLTSYCANYMRPVLEGHDEKARSKRRNICYGLSRITADKDKPLGRFGLDHGLSRFVGYQKGSMVFAMLAQKVGPDTLWRALGRLFSEQFGKPVGWNEIQRVIEKQSGQDLSAYFERWVRGSGVPDIVIDEAVYDPRARRLMVTVQQEGNDVFDVSVPIRLVFDDRTRDEMIVVNQPSQVAVINSLIAPKFIELDPDYHVMRRVPLKDVMPTISGIGKSKNLTIVRSASDDDAYAAVADRLEERYKKAEDTSVRKIEDSELRAEDLEQGHVLLLGEACRSPVVQAVLEGSPLSFGDGCFRVDGKQYDKPTQEVLCCLRNEHDVGGVICFFYGNNAADLKKVNVVTYYGGNSLVAFDDGKVDLRRDFERTQRVAVTSGS